MLSYSHNSQLFVIENTFICIHICKYMYITRFDMCPHLVIYGLTKQSTLHIPPDQRTDTPLPRIIRRMFSWNLHAAKQVGRRNEPLSVSQPNKPNTSWNQNHYCCRFATAPRRRSYAKMAVIIQEHVSNVACYTCHTNDLPASME